MKDLETMKITDPEGKEIEIKVITILKNADASKQFLVYTFDDTKENKLFEQIYAEIKISKGDKKSFKELFENR